MATTPTFTRKVNRFFRNVMVSITEEERKFIYEIFTLPE